jgi:hypothetical protein
MINITTPDRWVIIELHGQHKKVFGTWSGGYLDGDSWKANSGIVRCEVEDEEVLFYGMSGSIYKCRKMTYGTNAYGATILKALVDQQQIRILTKEEAFKFYNIEEE